MKKSKHPAHRKTYNGASEWTRRKRIARIVIGILTGLGLVASGMAIIMILSACVAGNSYPISQDSYLAMTEQMVYPVVRVSTPSGCGSGVIIHHKDTKNTKKEIYILTAGHVVGDESTVTVEIFTHPKPLLLEGISVVITDTIKDLALLRIETTDSHRLTQVYTARLAPENYPLRLFTPVWTVGCSLGLPPRPSFGHITAITHPQPLLLEGNKSVESVAEISAPIVPGNSGGPVYALDALGCQLIGITVAVKTFRGQLITTMARVVSINEILEFLTTGLSGFSELKNQDNQLNPVVE